MIEGLSLFKRDSAGDLVIAAYDAAGEGKK